MVHGGVTMHSGILVVLGAATLLLLGCPEPDDDAFPERWLPGPYDHATSPTRDCDDRDATVFPGSGC